MPLGKHEDGAVVLSFLLGIKHLLFTQSSRFMIMSTQDVHNRVTVNESCGGGNPRISPLINMGIWHPTLSPHNILSIGKRLDECVYGYLQEPSCQPRCGNHGNACLKDLGS